MQSETIFIMLHGITFGHLLLIGFEKLLNVFLWYVVFRAAK